MTDLSTCAIEDVLLGAESCAESFSGTGTEIFIAMVSDLSKAEVDIDLAKNRFTPASFNSLKGKLVKWEFEEETGEVTTEANNGGGGFNNKFELTIRKNMDNAAHSLRALNNLKFLAFVPDGLGGYYAFYSAMGSAKIDTVSGTTGKAATDEHGLTITISASPMYYPNMKWYPVSTENEDTPVDLNDWLASKQ